MVQASNPRALSLSIYIHYTHVITCPMKVTDHFNHCHSSIAQNGRIETTNQEHPENDMVANWGWQRHMLPAILIHFGQNFCGNPYVLTCFDIF